MTACAQGGFAIADVAVDRADGHGKPLVDVRMEIHGRTPVAELAAKLGD